MTKAEFRFYAELNDFLPPDKRQTPFTYPLNGDDQSVKHLIEAIGVPHTEVEAILVNGESVDFSYLVKNGDRVSVYPAFTQLDVSDLVTLRPSLTHPPRFILDIHLGQLARYLRLLGFDTLYPDDNHDDADLAQIAHDENRALLTRDHGLLKRGIVTYGYCILTRDSREQLTAVLDRFQLYDDIRPWRRCLKCNGRLHPIAKEKILHRLQPKTKKYYHEFNICGDCDQIYWKGSHYERIQDWMQGILDGKREV